MKQSEGTSSILESARQSYRKGRLLEAMSAWSHALEMNPGCEELISRLEFARDELEGIHEAMQELQSQLHQQPDDAMAHYTMANFHYTLGEDEKARAAFDRVMQLDHGTLGAGARKMLRKFYGEGD